MAIPHMRQGAPARKPDVTYDTAFEERLTGEILRAIAEASIGDVTIVIRTGEVIGALVQALALTLALSPSAVRTPTAIRQATDHLRKALVRGVAAARSSPEVLDLEARAFRTNDVRRGGRA